MRRAVCIIAMIVVSIVGALLARDVDRGDAGDRAAIMARAEGVVR